jgi:primosomal replication protein N
MGSALSLDNCLVIAGHTVGPSRTRYSPAGLPIAYFTLEHHSWQSEADIPREVRCRIQVLAGGKTLAPAAEKLKPGSWVRVRGFISRANNRQGEARLVLHAEQIKALEAPVENN